MMFFRIFLLNFAVEAKARAALAKILYWSSSWVFSMTLDIWKILLKLLKISDLTNFSALNFVNKYLIFNGLNNSRLMPL